MKAQSTKILTGLLTLLCLHSVWATSPARPLKVLECDVADEITYVLDRPYESLQVKMGDNPSTGYNWYVNAVLENSFESHCQDRIVPGCGGTKFFELSDDAIDAQKNKLTGRSVFKFRLLTPGHNPKTVKTCTIIIKN